MKKIGKYICVLIGIVCLSFSIPTYAKTPVDEIDSLIAQGMLLDESVNTEPARKWQAVLKPFIEEHKDSITYDFISGKLANIDSFGVHSFDNEKMVGALMFMRCELTGDLDFSPLDLIAEGTSLHERDQNHSSLEEVRWAWKVTYVFKQHPELDVSVDYEKNWFSQMVGTPNINKFNIKSEVINLLTILDEKIPVSSVLISIDIKVSPYKTDYIEGDKFIDEGAVLVASYEGTFRDGSKRIVQKTVTDYSVDITSSLNTTDEKWKYSYSDNGVTVETYQNISVEKYVPSLISSVLKEIRITKKPKKLTYITGESFATKGMVVKAVFTETWSDGSIKTKTTKITDYTVNASSKLTPKNNSVTILYSKDGVTVKKKLSISVTDATPYINTKKKTLCIGDELDLRILGTSKYVMWKSSDTRVATIAKNGILCATGIGKATITATVGSGKESKKFTCTITVKSRVTPSQSAFFLSPDEFGEFTISDATKKQNGLISINLKGNTASLDNDNSGNYVVIPEKTGLSVIEVYYTIPGGNTSLEASLPVFTYSKNNQTSIELTKNKISDDGYLTISFASGKHIAINDKNISASLNKYMIAKSTSLYNKSYTINRDTFESLITQASEKGKISIDE